MPHAIPTLHSAEPPAPRMMFYSHDTFGLGHIRRTLTLVREVQELSETPMQILVATGTPMLHALTLPENIAVLALRPVVKVGAEEYRARDGSMNQEQVVAFRSKQLLRAARTFQPDVVVVDHAPIGMKGEMLPMLSYLRAKMPRTRIILGLRDILDEPEVVRQLWREQQIYTALDRYYDRILVYGNREHFALDTAYGLPASITAKLVYCGYIMKNEPLLPAKDVRAYYGFDQEAPLLLATAGGGGDGSYILWQTLQALPIVRQDYPMTQALLVTGPLMDPAAQEQLAQAVEAVPGVRLVTYAQQMVSCIQAADAVIAMGGYNTICELLAFRRQSVIIPRTTPRREQLVRAQILAERQLLRVLEPQEATPETLGAQLVACLDEGNTVAGTDTGSLLGRERATVEILYLMALAIQAPSVETDVHAAIS